MKKCTKCGIEKPLSEFYKNRNKPRQDCKVCHEKTKIKSRIGAYGITVNQFNGMLVLQNNACAICKVKFIVKKHRHIDHDHKTGKVRGILCHKCNTSLGHFCDSIQILKSAIEYLSHNETKI
jgi:hypothetical protein